MSNRFVLSVDCGNAAFGETPEECNFELARILIELAGRIENNGLSGMYQNIKDVNGNIVGNYALKPESYFNR